MFTHHVLQRYRPQPGFWLEAITIFSMISYTTYAANHESCSIPRHPPRGYMAEPGPGNRPLMRLDNIQPGTNVVVMCRIGFVLLHGVNKTVCMADGTWNPDLRLLGKCRRPSRRQTTTEQIIVATSPRTSSRLPSKYCHLPIRRSGTYVFLHGRFRSIRTNVVAVGQHVELKCAEDSFIVHGAAKALCTATSEWTEKFGFCWEPGTVRPQSTGTSATTSASVKDCAEVTIENGSFLTSSPTNSGKKRRTIACNAGYIVRSNKEVLCLPTGLWSAEPGFCIETANFGKVCQPLPLIKGGSLIRTSNNESRAYWIGDEVRIQCNPGYRFVSTSLLVSVDSGRLVRCKNDGEWSSLQGHCVKQCNKVPAVKNGYIKLGSFDAGSVRSVACNLSDQAVVGPVDIFCCWNGEWTKPGACFHKAKALSSLLFFLKDKSEKCPSNPNKIDCSGYDFVFKKPCMSPKTSLIEGSNGSQNIFANLLLLLLLITSTQILHPGGKSSIA